jgi:hypothetical protein
MPITPQHTYKPLSQAEFGPLSYEVFADVIAIRQELGRFFDEKHYKKALAQHRKDVILEAPILVSIKASTPLKARPAKHDSPATPTHGKPPRHRKSHLGQHQPSPYRHPHDPPRELTEKWGLFAFAALKQPNFVIILADDLGYGDMQANNPERGKIPTPNMNRLAAEGMRFTDGHSSSGCCSPSRYTLLTGRYHWRTTLQAASSVSGGSL